MAADDCQTVIFVCDACDDIHIANVCGETHEMQGQIIIPRASLGNIIVELTKLRERLNQ